MTSKETSPTGQYVCKTGRGKYGLFVTLHTTADGQEQRIYFFHDVNSTSPTEGEPSPLPPGYEVELDSGYPKLKKKSVN